MTPDQLRSFRESLGLSRREFAPKLFISEPTLERWERGQGAPREIHLQILRRMRDHLAAGQTLAYFKYDEREIASAAGILQPEKAVITDTLRGMGIVLVTEETSDAKEEWSLEFHLAWDISRGAKLVLLTKGSEQPQRPMIDFFLSLSAKFRVPEQSAQEIQRACFDHRISWMWEQSARRTIVTLAARLFKPGCNAESVAHVVGNFHSCWNRLRGVLAKDGDALVDSEKAVPQ